MHFLGVNILKNKILIKLSIFVTHVFQILELIVKWLKHDWDKRRTHAPSLLKQVRLGLVPKESITELMDSTILAIPECKKLFQEVMKGLESQGQLSLKTSNLFKSRGAITVSKLP